VITEKPTPAAEQGDDASNLFYKAFYLEVGAQQYPQAAELYRKFLAQAADSKLAPRAARSLVNLLRRTDKADAADAAEKQFATLLARAGEMRPGGPQGAGPGGRGAGRGPGGAPRPGGAGRPGGQGGAGRGAPGAGGDPAARIADTKKAIERAEAQLAEAKEGGDDQMVERLTNQITRMKDRLKQLESGAPAGAGQGRGGAGRGGAGQGRGGAGGRAGFNKPLSEMTQEEATQWVERIEQFLPRMIERMEEEQAKKAEDGLKKVKELVKAGKLEEAEKVRKETLTFGRGR
jgi:hypothetical protein